MQLHVRVYIPSQNHQQVDVRIRPRLVARPGTKQDDIGQTPTLQPLQAAPKLPQDFLELHRLHIRLLIQNVG
jgi:hypothetical protein